MCLGGGGSSKPQLQQRTLPAEGTRPADESTRSPKNPYASATQSRLENETDQRKLFRWDDHNETWKDYTGAKVLADPALDLWVPPGGMDLPSQPTNPSK